MWEYFRAKIRGKFNYASYFKPLWLVYIPDLKSIISNRVLIGGADLKSIISNRVLVMVELT